MKSEEYNWVQIRSCILRQITWLFSIQIFDKSNCNKFSLSVKNLILNSNLE